MRGFAYELVHTKTFWAGLAGIISGVGMIVMGQTPEGITTIVISIQQICHRDSKIAR